MRHRIRNIQIAYENAEKDTAKVSTISQPENNTGS